MKTRRLSALGAVVTLAVAAVAAQFVSSVPTSHAAPSFAAQKMVHVQETNSKYHFGTGKITVKVGTKVTWVNATDAPHTVTGKGNFKFSSKMFKQHGSVHYVFNTTGTYKYFCSVHPYMKGTVVVSG